MGWGQEQGKFSSRFRVNSIHFVIINSFFLQLIVESLIYELDPNHDGIITEEEFGLICKYISQQGNDSFPPIKTGNMSGTSRSGMAAL